MRLRTPAGAVVSGLILTLTASLGLTASADAAPEPRASKAAKVAQRALDRIEAALDGTGTDRRDLSSAYRELFVNRAALRGEARDDATSVLARPTTPPDDPNDPRDIYYGEDADLHSQCSGNLCLHWVEEGEHAATPAFAAEVFATLLQVSTQYSAAGLKLPLPDEGQEGSTQTDFYLGDIGAAGALGFCRSDSETPTVGSAYAAYCGFDNDFAGFGYDGVETLLMQVTVAHEYFHAIQYAYDAEDEGWIYESTAAWVEDEIFDDVNDSAFFLNFGQQGDPDGPFGYPFAGPTFPLDVLDDFGGFNTYGNWGFWRYLTEQHPASTAGFPDLVRQFWEALDTTQGTNPTSAREALERVLGARKSSIPDEYVGYAAANQRPADFYEEGGFYPTAPDGYAPVELSASSSQATRSVTLDHLTSASGEAVPFADGYDLQVRLTAPAAAYSRVAVVVVGLDGSTRTRWIALNKQGRGAGTVPFSADRVASVEVTAANGSSLDAVTADLTFRAVR